MKINLINGWKLIDDMPLIQIELVILNVSLFQVYIDRYKMNLSLLGFTISIWYKDE